MSILDYFPAGLTPRHEQRALLLQIEAEYNAHDVLCILMPTGAGKTEVAVTVGAWLAARGVASNYLLPDNVLVAQTAERYPHLQTLLKQDLYRCAPFDRSCAVTKKRCKQFCPDCPYVAAKTATKAARVRVMNVHTYLAHKLYAPVAIIDEAHKLTDMLEDIQGATFWRGEYGFPDGLATVADVLEWGQEHLRENPEDDSLRYALAAAAKIRDAAIVEYGARHNRGKADVYLQVRPQVARSVPPWLWPQSKVKKLVLMSATIGPKDIDELGLSRRRVLYLECDSPIPADRRPIVYKPVCNMAARYADKALPMLADEIRRRLDSEPGKGLIHLPYQLASQLRGILSHPRLLYHGRDDKTAVLSAFKSAPPDSGAVLIASGLYEGLDLPYDMARWQVVGKVPYLSLGDARIKERAEADGDWYEWQAIKRLVQACGRIVRAPDDRGTTYIFDVNYRRLLDKDRRRPVKLFPAYHLQALQGA